MQWETTENKKISARWYKILRTCFIKNLQKLRKLTRCLQFKRTWKYVIFMCVLNVTVKQTTMMKIQNAIFNYAEMLKMKLNLLKQCLNKLSMKSWFWTWFRTGSGWPGAVAARPTRVPGSRFEALSGPSGFPGRADPPRNLPRSTLGIFIYMILYNISTNSTYN